MLGSHSVCRWPPASNRWHDRTGKLLSVCTVPHAESERRNTQKESAKMKLIKCRISYSYPSVDHLLDETLVESVFEIVVQVAALIYSGVRHIVIGGGKGRVEGCVVL